MKQISGYEILNRIQEGSLFEIYSGIDRQSKRRCLLKTLKTSAANAKNAERLSQEYRMASQLPFEGMLKPKKMVWQENLPVLIYDDDAEIPLSQFLREIGRLDISQFFSLATHLSFILARIHSRHQVFYNLHPENIFINAFTLESKLMGFGTPDALRFPYMSPEETGRTEHTPDHRSDLYSLGVILYEAITGRLPIHANSAIEWFHAHIAVIPEAPRQIAPEIPAVISDLIMTLLCKDPDDRYQSAYGVLKELRQLHNRWQESGILPPAAKLEHRRYALHSQTKLYGRDADIKVIMQAYERVCSGTSELILITGTAGTGKTALVNQVRHALKWKNGFYAIGKFDQLNPLEPFAPIIQVFKSLIRQKIIQDEQSIEQFRQGIMRTIGTNWTILADSIPELAWLLDKPSRLPNIHATEAPNLLQHVCKQFLKLFAGEDRPLVVFLDDLQWADDSSLRLLHELIADPTFNHFLMIVAYREQYGERLANLLPQDQHDPPSNKSVTKIALTPLSRQKTDQWVRDAFQLNPGESLPITSILHRITAGNPFYISQLLFFFVKEEWIRFDVDRGKWHWQPPSDVSISFSDDIASFLFHRVKELPVRVRTLLQIAACIGNTFDLRTLAAATELPSAEIAADISAAVQEGLIFNAESHSPDYRFVHDRVQQLVYSTIPASEIPSIHLRIGRYLLSHEKAIRHKATLAVAVSHLNLGRSLMTSPAERLDLAAYNLLSGQFARDTSAFAQALEYFIAGMELLPASAWEDHYDLMFGLALGRGECSYMNGQLEEAETLFDLALKHASSLTDRLKVYRSKILLYTHLERYREAALAGMDVLRQAGFSLPKRVRPWMIVKEWLSAKIKLKGRTAQDLIALPRNKDKDQQLMLEILHISCAPALQFSPELGAYLMLKTFTLMLTYGKTDFTPLAFNNYGIILGSGFGHYKQAYVFGLAAKRLAEQSDSPNLKCQVHFVLGSFIYPWIETYEKVIAELKEARQLAMEAGNLHIAGACSSFITTALWIRGKPLNDLLNALETELQFSRQIKFKQTIDYLEQSRVWFSELRTTKPGAARLNMPEIPEPTTLIFYHAIRLQASYLLKDAEAARETIEKIGKCFDALPATLLVTTEYLFYWSLWLAHLYRNAQRPQQRKIMRRLLRNQRMLEKRADHNPGNYLHKYQIVSAEIARINGKKLEALALYEEAAERARKEGYLLVEAIAKEAAGWLAYEIGHPHAAFSYLSAAVQGYREWGAERRAMLLEAAFPSTVAAYASVAVSEESSREDKIPDMKTLSKALQSIAKERRLDNLIHELLIILMENAGAHKVVLLLGGERDYRIEGVIDLEQGEQRFLQSIPYADHPSIPVSVIQYVIRTQETVVLTDAARSGIFINDPYIKRLRPRSILCLPILYQKKMMGALYMENAHATHVFTPKRLEILALLSSQAAISIENARLYSDMEKKVHDKTRELKESYHELEKVYVELHQMEQSRRQLLSNISHDLLAPITSIQGYLEAIRDGVIEHPADQRLYISRAYTRLIGLKRLIQDLLALSQLKALKIQLEKEFVPVDQLLRHMHHRFEWEVLNAHLTFELHLGRPPEKDGLYPLVEIDLAQMERLFANLISNAVKFTPPQGVIRMGWELLETEEHHQQAMIYISDSGIGIAEEDLPFLFDRFYTGHHQGKKRTGSGLGLAICKEIIALHQGEIHVQSKVGEGTVFSFTLPIVHI